MQAVNATCLMDSHDFKGARTTNRLIIDIYVHRPISDK